MGSNLTHTVSGDLVSFKSADTGHIESLKVNFLPVQEGSGDPSSSNVRTISGWNGLDAVTAGKNLVNFSQTTIGPYSQYVNGQSQWHSVSTKIDAAVRGRTVTFSAYIDATNTEEEGTNYYSCVKIWAKKPDGTWGYLAQEGTKIYKGESGWSTITKTLNNTYYDYAFGIGLRIGAIANSPMVEYGSERTTYEPYRGQIIPVTFPVLGKNKFNPNATYVQGSSGTWKYYKFTDDDETYKISFIEKDPSIDLSNINMLFASDPSNIEKGYKYIMTKGVIQSSLTNLSNGGLKRVGQPKCKYITFSPTSDATIEAILAKYDIQIELGISTTSYEPYNPYNTVYGGYIDLAKGELVAEWITETIDKNRLISFSPSEASANHATFETTYHFWKYRYNGNNSQFCNILKVLPNVSQWANQISDNTIGFLDTTGDEYSKAFRMKIANITTKSDMENWLDNNPVQICYKLYTPITYPLSKSQLQTLLGQNHIWSNANSTTEVTYQFQDHLIKKHLSLYNPEFIPPKYEKCDYLIQSNHNTKFDTGVSGDDQTLKIHCEFMPLSLVASYIGILGNYQTESDNKCWRIITLANTASNFQKSFYVCCGSVAASGTNGQSLTATPVNSGETVINKKITADLSYGTYTMTGTKTVTETHNKAPSIPASEYNIAIGSSRIATGNGSVNTTKFRLYNFRFRSQNKLIRNYVPVIRRSDRLAGFYDTVNGTFNPSVGNKEFIGGFEDGEILLPSGYTKVNRLVQNGINTTYSRDETSYINLHRKFDSTHRYRFIVNFDNSLEISNNFLFFGAREQTDHIPKNTSFTYASNTLLVFYGITNGYNQGYTSAPNLTNTISEDQEIEIKVIDGLFTLINSEGLYRAVPNEAMTRESFQSETDTCLGGINCKGYDTPYYYWRPGSYIKLYEEYDENDNLITKFVPCIRNSDNIAGMYDIITNTFWPSDNPNYQFIAE